MSSGQNTSTYILERRLRAQLLKDRRKPSRRRIAEDDTIIVSPSGFASGLAYAISLRTGEDDEAIMNRVTSE